MVVGHLIQNRQPRVLRYITPILAGSIVTLVVIAQWISGSFESVGSSLKWVPMAPLTAIFFLLIGAVLLLQRQLHAGRILSGIIRAASVFMLLVSSYLVLYNFMNALPIDIEGFMAAPTTLASGSIIGRMSPITAILLILVSISFFISTLQRERPDRLLFMTDVLTLGVLVTALVILLGYWYGVPLFYGGTIIPVALPSAISFLLVSTAQLFNKPENLFYHFATSHSVTAQICRAIIPISILILLIGGYLEEVIKQYVESDMYPEIEVGSTFILVVAITLIVSVVSRRIDRDIAQNEMKLRSSENSYLQLLEKGNDGIVILQDGLVKFANSKVLEMTGFSQKNDVLGKPLTDFVSQQSTELVMDRYKKRLAGEEVPEIYEIEILNKDGSLEPVEVNASLIEYEGKSAVISMIRGITERKRRQEQLRMSEENFRLSLDNSPLGIFIVSSEGKVFYANQVILDIYGFASIEELEATPTQQCYTPESYAEYQVRKEMRQSGEYVPYNYEINVVRKDGLIRNLDIMRKEVEVPSIGV